MQKKPFHSDKKSYDENGILREIHEKYPVDKGFICPPGALSPVPPPAYLPSGDGTYPCTRQIRSGGCTGLWLFLGGGRRIDSNAWIYFTGTNDGACLTSPLLKPPRIQHIIIRDPQHLAFE